MATYTQRPKPIEPELAPELITPPAVTPALAYADLGLAPYDQGADGMLNGLLDQTRATLTTPFDEKSVYRNKIKEYQAETNATNRIFAEKMNSLNQDKQAQVGRARAMEAAGAGGYGGIVTATANANRPIDMAAAENQAKIAQIMNTARSAATSEVEAKRAARRTGYNDYITFLKERDTRQETYADQIAQAAFDQGVDIAEVDLATLSKQYGIPQQSILSAFTAKRQAADEAARKQQFEEAKAEVRYNPETGEYESTAPVDPVSVSDGSALIDPLTGEVIYDNPEDYEPDAISPLGGEIVKINGVDYIQNPDGTLGVPEVPTLPESESQAEIRQRALTVAKDLRQANSTGKRGAVGFGFQKILPSLMEKGLQPNRASFEAKVETLRASLTFENLKALKGAMSDKDLSFLQSIGSTLNTNMDEAEFDRQLDLIINRLESAGATDGGTSQMRVRLQDGQTGTIDAADFDPATMTAL